MRPFTAKDMQDVNAGLQCKAFHVYRKILRTLCRHHPDAYWSKPILSITRPKKWTKESVEDLVRFGDLLSSQLYKTSDEHFVANQIALLIRKYPYPKDINPFDPEGAAIRTFERSERKCARINSYFRAVDSGKHFYKHSEIFGKARDWIQYVIGSQPNLPQIYSQCGFGSGASVDVHGSATNVARKLLASKWTVTPGAFNLAYGAVTFNLHTRTRLCVDELGFSSGIEGHMRSAFAQTSKVITYNKLAFVLKTVRTHRSIAVEPLLNSFVQKGIDNTFRLFLKRVGIDLSNQELNQTMAMLGSLDDSEEGYVTIDLRSASDSIAILLVMFLFPRDWFEILNQARSKSYSYKGTSKSFEKFCTMGNGFCFPLQTLIFASLCEAVGARRSNDDYRVYGDDIVIRRKYAKDLIKYLRIAGFETNKSKTFLEGPFRESCGADWFKGEDVRPYTLDYSLDSIQDYFKFLNGSLRNDRTTRLLQPIRELVLKELPKRYHFFRPFKGNEDSGIDSIGDEFLYSDNCRFEYQSKAQGKGHRRTFIDRCWTWREIITTAKTDFDSEIAVLSSGFPLMYAALDGSASRQPFSLRRKTRTSVRKISHGGATSQWYPAATPIQHWEWYDQLYYALQKA